MRCISRRKSGRSFGAELAFIFVVTWTCLLAGTLSGHAAQLVNPNYEDINSPSKLDFTPICNLTLFGPINGPREEDGVNVPGDASKMEADLQDFQVKAAEARSKFISYPDQYFGLCLNSRGGDLREALKIAELFKGWMTIVDSGDECVSACAVIFMSAPPRDRVFRYSSTSPGRFLHVKGRLGFHAPELTFPDEVAAKMTQAEAASMAQVSYSRALETLRQVAFPRVGKAASTRQDDSSEVSVTATEPGDYPGSFLYQTSIPGTVTIPTELLLAFLTVPPHQVFYIKELEEALSWGIEIYGYPSPKALTATMLASACINVAAARCAFSPENECTNRPQEMLASVELANKLALDLEKEIAECKLKEDPACSQDGMRGRRITSLRRTLDKLAAGTDAKYEKLEIPYGVLSLALVKGSQTTDFLKKDLQVLFNIKSHELTKKRELPSMKPLQYIFGFELEGKRGGNSVCHVRARWSRDFLVKDRIEYNLIELKIDTSSEGAQTGRPLLQQAYDEDDDITLMTSLGSAQSSRYVLRPWRMLPAGALLKDLEGQEAWSGLDEGENFFGIPFTYIKE